jgi:hypothetical protein
MKILLGSAEARPLLHMAGWQNLSGRGGNMRVALATSSPLFYNTAFCILLCTPRLVNHPSKVVGTLLQR